MQIEMKKHNLPAAVLRIGKQVHHLIKPQFHTLRLELELRERGIEKSRKALLQKRERIAEEGIVAATRLLLPDEAELRLINEPYFQQLKRLSKGDNHE